jgi:hypothetical protein
MKTEEIKVKRIILSNEEKDIIDKFSELIFHLKVQMDFEKYDEFSIIDEDGREFDDHYIAELSGRIEDYYFYKG